MRACIALAGFGTVGPPFHVAHGVTMITTSVLNVPISIGVQSGIQGTGLTPIGTIIMSVSITSILVLVVCCYRRILRRPDDDG